ncbi:stress-induced protein [Massilia sp. RP-1-19]|uniref:Stress-induced protein n=1 Tax=Massilia polaris TaxID=2728846 RepID=A0A848HGF7_9BURK|nr:KGG domain-containing protein [Massilia polaris]NML60966.1 stress-induced protein [Massilia polaris]
MAKINQGGNKGPNQQSGGIQDGGRGNKQSDTSKRGFASMDPDKQRAIASQGGRAAHASGNAHEFTSQEAREAGKLSHGGGNRQSGTSDSGGKAGGGNQGGSGAGSR